MVDVDVEMQMQMQSCRCRCRCRCMDVSVDADGRCRCACKRWQMQMQMQTCRCMDVDVDVKMQMYRCVDVDVDADVRLKNWNSNFRVRESLNMIKKNSRCGNRRESSSQWPRGSEKLNFTHKLDSFALKPTFNYNLYIPTAIYIYLKAPTPFVPKAISISIPSPAKRTVDT